MRATARGNAVATAPWRRVAGAVIACAVALVLLWSQQGAVRSSPRARGEKFVTQGENRRPDAVQFGNAALEGEGHARWFAGHFMGDGNLLKNDDLEIKWSESKRGTTKANVGVNGVGRTICLLVSGKHLVDFGDFQVLLERRGDYVTWGAGVPHTWTAVTDVVIVTIRWPSVSGDQKAVDSGSFHRDSPEAEANPQGPA